MSMVEMLEAELGSLDATTVAIGMEGLRMAALGTGCHNPECQNLEGEAVLQV